jgi:hypothetical protein
MFFYVTAAGFLASLLLGGATQHGSLSDAILQIVSVPFMLVAIWRLGGVPKSTPLRWSIAFCGAIVALPLLQLAPLPPILWTHLPGRNALTSAYALLGDPLAWAPISLARDATWLSALSLLPPLALFLAVVTLNWRDRRRLSLVLAAFAVVSGLIGLMQKAQGSDSVFRFYASVDATQPLGFFPNQNLLAALLYCGAMTTTAWMLASLNPRRSNRRSQNRQTMAIAVGSGLALLTLISVEIVTRSRAGVFLMFVGLCVLLAVAFFRSSEGGLGEDDIDEAQWRLGRPAIGGIIALVGAALLFVGWSSLGALLDRLARDPLGDERPVFARVTFLAAEAFLPAGSGLGSFIPTYQMFEKPKDLFVISYANHAHNDLLELALETGIGGLLLVCVFLAWLIIRARRALMDERRPVTADTYLVDASIVTILLLLIHSLVDYPLRTSALASVFAFSCALLIEPPAAALPRRADRRR